MGGSADAQRGVLSSLALLSAGLLFLLLASSARTPAHYFVQLKNRLYHHASTASTVGELLSELGITVEEAELLGIPLSEALTPGGTIYLPLEEERVEQVLTVPPPVVYQTRPVEKPNGESPRVIDPGRSGKLRRLVRLYLLDGKLVGKHIKRTWLSRPKPAKVELPVSPLEHIPSVEEILRDRLPPSRRLPPPKFYRKKLTMEATAYYNSESGGINKWTATGLEVGYGIVAVDPKVIPLGTRVYVEGYGYAVAADTGGAIKGMIVDVAMLTRQEAITWGRRKVTVWIID